MTETFEHLTLTTGHRLTQHRDQVDPDVIQTLRPLAATLMQPDAIPRTAPMPGGIEGYTLQGVCLSPGFPLFRVQVGPGPVAVVSFGIATANDPSADETPAAHLFHTLLHQLSGVVPPDHVPPAPAHIVPPDLAAATPLPVLAAPWCAVVVHPALANHPDANAWLDDFEHCLTWAVIDEARR